jgi:hypothetical protein
LENHFHRAPVLYTIARGRSHASSKPSANSGLISEKLLNQVAAAVRDAIARGAIGFDAVKHLVLCRIVIAARMIPFPTALRCLCVGSVFIRGRTTCASWNTETWREWSVPPVRSSYR